MLGWNSDSAKDYDMNASAHESVLDVLMVTDSSPFVGEASGDAIDTGQFFVGCFHGGANKFCALCVVIIEHCSILHLPMIVQNSVVGDTLVQGCRVFMSFSHSGVSTLLLFPQCVGLYC